MTIAICLKCGETKFGAFNPCEKCGYEPKMVEERARSMFLSGHYLAGPQLEFMGEQIKRGTRIQFEEKQLEEMIAILKRTLPPSD